MAQSPGAIDAIVLDAQIRTFRRPGERVEALALSGGRIAAMGPAAEMRALAPGAPVIEGGGRTAIPGFVDSHCHADMQAVRAGRWLDLAEAVPRDREALLARIATEAAGRPRASTICAFRFDDLTMGGWPTRDQLDAAVGGRAALIYRRCSLVALASTAALAAMGWDETAGDPPFGRLERDRQGRPTGLVHGRAARMLVEHASAAQTDDDFLAGMERVLARYAALGVTSIQNSTTQAAGFAAYQRLHAAGGLKVRVGVIANGHDEGFWQGLLGARMRSGLGDERLRLTGVEWVADGATSARTAAWHAPYQGEPGNRGAVLMDRDDLVEKVETAHRAGLSVCVDAMGDRGVDFVIEAFEAALARFPVEDHRARIEHCCAVTPQAVGRLKRAGIVASTAAGFAHDLGAAHLAARGPGEMARLWPMRALIDAGVPAPIHSDAPVCDENPLLGLWSLVNRRAAGGEDLDPSQACTVEEGLHAYTRLGAWAGREEHLKGHLAPGMLADLAFLDRDPLAIPPADLRGLRCEMTVIGGEIVHDAR